MKTLFDKQVNPNWCLGYVHVPKCGGTYIKNRLSTVAKSAGLYEYDYAFHEPVDFIRGYRAGNKFVPRGAINLAGSDEPRNINNLFLISIRDAFEWYDSWFYYKKSFKERNNKNLMQPLTPLYHELGDYEKALENSLSDEWLEKISFSVLQNGFCPSSWMKALDIGFYTAWFLYMIVDHKHVFDNLDCYRGDKLTKNLSKMNTEFPGLVFNIKHAEHHLRTSIGTFFNLDYLKYSKHPVEDDRRTDYDEGYLKCSEVFANRPDLKEKFLWKERLMINLIEKTNRKGE